MAIAELGDDVIEMLMIERRQHFLLQDPIERGKVCREARGPVDGCAHGHLEMVQVTVAMRVAAGTEHLAVAFFTPLRSVVPVSGGEANPAREKGLGHWQQGRFAGEHRPVGGAELARGCGVSRSIVGEAAYSHG